MVQSTIPLSPPTFCEMDTSVRPPAGDAPHRDLLKLDSLPDEVLQQILYYCAPDFVLKSVQLLSKRFRELANAPLLWRYHCRVGYKYWDSRHRIRNKWTASIGDVDWKALYIRRSAIDALTTSFLDSILEGQARRIVKYKMIADFGYDVKDALLRHCRTPSTADDVLARRYYATSILDHVHRLQALEEWKTLLEGGSVSLERALGAFDLFVLHDQNGDLLEISDLFDDLALRLRNSCPALDEMTSRKKAMAVVKFLLQNNLVGLASEIAYRDLQNNYIGIALQDPNHPSIPLISVAIFCVLAQRLGLDARCCGIPTHVHAMVYPAPGETLDDTPLRNATQGDPMYLDPYQQDTEVSVQVLRTKLQSWGIPAASHHSYLGPISTHQVVARTSRNILAAVREFRGQAGAATNNGHPTITLHANPFADLDNAFYSALWANYIFGGPSRPTPNSQQRTLVPLILERFEKLYPMDASLISSHIVPLFAHQHNGQAYELHEALRVVHAADQSPKQKRSRSERGLGDLLSWRARGADVKYKVGQVFRHVRYGYLGVVTGWDVECGAGNDWIRQNNVDELNRGRNQSFYHALVEDSSIRYVAEENIHVIEPEEPSSLMGLAGKFFKRWDKEAHVFISNIRDEYPED